MQLKHLFPTTLLLVTILFFTSACPIPEAEKNDAGTQVEIDAGAEKNDAGSQAEIDAGAEKNDAGSQVEIDAGAENICATRTSALGSLQLQNGFTLVTSVDAQDAIGPIGAIQEHLFIYGPNHKIYKFGSWPTPHLGDEIFQVLPSTADPNATYFPSQFLKTDNTGRLVAGYTGSSNATESFPGSISIAFLENNEILNLKADGNYSVDFYNDSESSDLLLLSALNIDGYSEQSAQVYAYDLSKIGEIGAAFTFLNVGDLARVSSGAIARNTANELLVGYYHEGNNKAALFTENQLSNIKSSQMSLSLNTGVEVALNNAANSAFGDGFAIIDSTYNANGYRFNGIKSVLKTSEGLLIEDVLLPLETSCEYIEQIFSFQGDFIVVMQNAAGIRSMHQIHRN